MKDRSFLWAWIFLTTSILLRVLTPILFKSAAMSMDRFTLMAIVTNTLYLLSFVLFFARAFTWQLALRKIDLSVAFALTSLSYIGLLITGYFFFHEAVHWNHIAGCLIIIAGTYYLSTKKKLR